MNETKGTETKMNEKKKYNAEYRRAQYIKHRAAILAKQKEYDDAHREKIKKRMRNYYRKKCGLRPEVEK